MTDRLSAKSFSLAGALFFVGLCSRHSQADTSLEHNLTAFFQLQFSKQDQQVKVNIRTPKHQWPLCDAPQFSLPKKSRPWGNISLLVQCPNDARYLQVDVQVLGHYPVTQSALRRGQTLQPNQFHLVLGQLERLPTGSMMLLSQLEGAVLLRDVAAGQPITQGMIRRSWVIKAGQSVQILAQGHGFNVMTEGKALNNAAVEELVRIRMPSGQIVLGKATVEGKIELTL